MSVVTLKPTVIVQAALGLLVRELTLPALVWNNAVGDFAGAYNDTISIRLPAFVSARTRGLRSGDSRTQDSLAESKVDLTLDTDIYLDVPITDEELTLDIVDFSAQVLNPMIAGMARKYEEEIADVITGASYETELTYDISNGDPYGVIAVPARTALNNAFVPYAGRSLVVGSTIEAAFLTDELFVRADKSGGTSTRTDAMIGRVAGFDVYSSPAIPADEAYAFHKTAFAVANRAPVVPAGAPYGASASYQGMAIRVVRVFDPDAVADRLILDSWMGAQAVEDNGHWTDDPDAGGKFVPVSDPNDPVTGHSDAWLNDSSKLVRAVKITSQA